MSKDSREIAGGVKAYYKELAKLESQVAQAAIAQVHADVEFEHLRDKLSDLISEGPEVFRPPLRNNGELSPQARKGFRVCDSCNGTGWDEKTDAECVVCGGSGEVV